MGNNVVRLLDCQGLTVAVDWDEKQQTRQFIFTLFVVLYEFGCSWIFVQGFQS